MHEDRRGQSLEVSARKASDSVRQGKVNYTNRAEIERLQTAILAGPDPKLHRDDLVALEARARLGG